MQRALQTDRARGFSLVELVLVLVIAATFAAIAAPRFTQAAARQRLQAAADRVASDLTLAQERARAASASTTLTFDPDQGLYQFNAVGGASRTIELDEPPYLVKISSVEFNSLPVVSFNMYGVPEHAGSIVLTGGGDSVTIQVTETGEVIR